MAVMVRVVSVRIDVVENVFGYGYVRVPGDTAHGFKSSKGVHKQIVTTNNIVFKPSSGYFKIFLAVNKTAH